MRILVVNDDGINSEKLKLLVKAASRYGFVYVAAPMHHMSATSHAITIAPKINVSYDVHIPNSERTIAVAGNPADCVRVGLKAFDVNFDLIISGVNDGYNIATDTIYSGTVSGAREGAILNIPSFAVSTNKGISINLENKLIETLDLMIGKELYKAHNLYNVNIPKADEIKGFKITTQGKRLYHAELTELSKKEYKITYSMMNYEEADTADTEAIDNGYVSITPLTLDQTDYEVLKKIDKKL